MLLSKWVMINKSLIVRTNDLDNMSLKIISSIYEWHSS